MYGIMIDRNGRAELTRDGSSNIDERFDSLAECLERLRALNDADNDEPYDD